MKLGLTMLRVVIGGTFFMHGAQKLFGWFGGHGLDATRGMFEQIGLKPGKRNAVLAGAAEAGGGAMIATGFLSPLGSTAVIAVMDQAVRTVHWEKGFANTAGGYEYNLALAATAFALADTGPGPWSLDRALGTGRSGPMWALAALGAGLAGPRLVARLAPAEEAPEAPPRFQREGEPTAQPAAASSPAA